MKKIKFALIGCGRIGSRHAEIISTKAELTAVCDISNEKAEKFSEKYRCRKYCSFEELLNKETDTDVVSICTPNYLHAEHTIKSLAAGKHVLCEKPMALNASDCMKMIREADRNKRKLFIVKQNRFNPPVARLKELIDRGKIGKIFNFQLNCFWNRNDEYYRNSDWKGKKALDGGTLFTQFSHFIDLMYWMMGDVKNIIAIGKNYMHELIEFEDTGCVLIEFKNGGIGTINYTVNACNKNMEGSVTVFGEKATVKIGGQYLNVLEYQSFSDNYKIENLPESRPANDYGFYQGSMSNHEKVYDNVIDVLTTGGIIAANAYDGMKTVEIIERIYSSMNKK